jgi:hypothetical protein
LDLKAATYALKSHFTGNWPHAEIPCGFPNEPFDKPFDERQQPLPFLVKRIEWNGSETNTIGAPGDNRMRRMGLLWFDVLIPVGTSDDKLQSLMSDAGTLYENEDIGPVTCLEADPGGKAESDDGNYSGESIAIAFTYDETA